MFSGRGEHGFSEIFRRVDFRRDAVWQANVKSVSSRASNSTRSRLPKPRSRSKREDGPSIAERLRCQFGQERAQDFNNAFAHGGAIELCAGCGHQTPEEQLSERLPRSRFDGYLQAAMCYSEITIHTKKYFAARSTVYSTSMVANLKSRARNGFNDVKILGAIDLHNTMSPTRLFYRQRHNGNAADRS